MAKKSKPVLPEAPALSLEELIKQKIAMGLTPEQAESTARRQLARDAAEPSPLPEGEDENNAEA